MKKYIFLFSFVLIILSLCFAELYGISQVYGKVPGEDPTHVANRDLYKQKTEEAKNTMDRMLGMGYFRTLPEQISERMRTVLKNKSDDDFKKILEQELAGEKNTLGKSSPKNYVASKIAAQGCSSLLQERNMTSTTSWEGIYQRLTQQDKTAGQDIKQYVESTSQTYGSALQTFETLMSSCRQTYEMNKKLSTVLLYAQFSHAFLNQNEHDAPYDIMSDIVTIDKLVLASTPTAGHQPAWSTSLTSYGEVVLGEIDPILSLFYGKDDQEKTPLKFLNTKQLPGSKTKEQIYTEEKNTYSYPAASSFETCSTDAPVKAIGSSSLQTTEKDAVVRSLAKSSLQQTLSEQPATTILIPTPEEKKKGDDWFKKLLKGEALSQCGKWDSNGDQDLFGQNVIRAGIQGGICARVELVSSTQKLIDMVNIGSLNTAGAGATSLLDLISGDDSLIDMIGRLKDLTQRMNERDLHTQKIPRQNFELSELFSGLNLSTSFTIEMPPSFPLTPDEADPKNRKAYAEKVFQGMVSSPDGRSVSKTLNFFRGNDPTRSADQLRSQMDALQTQQNNLYKKNRTILTMALSWQEFAQKSQERFAELDRELQYLGKYAKSLLKVSNEINTIPCYK